MAYLATHKICLNADKTKVVACSSKEAAHTLAEEGDIVPHKEAVKYGLFGEVEKPEPEEKSVKTPPQNKAKSAADEDK